MKALNWHIEAIKIVVDHFNKRSFWLYFIPGFIVLVLFLLFSGVIHLFFNLGKSEADGWIAYLFMGWKKIGSVLQYISSQIFIFSVITLLSPFNTLLSEKLDCHLTGQKFNFTLSRILSDFFRMLGIVAIAILLEMVMFFIWWLISKIIGISHTFPYQIIQFIIGAFFFGFSFYDHSLERYNISIKGSLNFAFNNPLIVVITGVCFKILYYFPYLWSTPTIGIVLAPVLTTMISTVVYLFYCGKLIPKSNN